MSSFSRRTSVIRGVYGCLDAKVHVRVNDKLLEVNAIACSRDVSRDRSLLVDKVIQSAKVQGYAQVMGVNIQNQQGVAKIYPEALLNSNVSASIVSYEFRYSVSDRRIKTVNRGGKRYNYVFSRTTGRIISYSRFRSPRNIDNYLKDED